MIGRIGDQLRQPGGPVDAGRPRLRDTGHGVGLTRHVGTELELAITEASDALLGME